MYNMSFRRTESLFWMLLFVTVVRSVAGFPARDLDRPRMRRARFVHYADVNPYGPCQRNGYRQDLRLTQRTILQNNDTLARMKQEVFRSGSYDADELPTSAYIEESSGLVPLFRNLSCYQATISTVIHEARHMSDYSATLRRSMHNTRSDLNNLLYKLNLTMTVAGQMGEPTVPEGWTADAVPLPDVDDDAYGHYLRDFAFFHWLRDTLEALRDQLVARLEEC